MTNEFETRDARHEIRPRRTFGCVPRLVSHVSIIGLAILAVACGSTPERDLPTLAATASSRAYALGDEIALRAIAQVGKPYIYGGADLNGFDCSGLVYYIHRELGY